MLASCSLRWPLSRTMKRLPSLVSMRPLRAVVTASTLPREATIRTLRPLVVSLAACQNQAATDKGAGDTKAAPAAKSDTKSRGIKKNRNPKMGYSMR